MTRSPARTVFFGSGRFAVPILRRLAAAPEVDLVGVVTAPARPAGRRADPTPTPIEGAARELGLRPILTPARLRAPDAVAQVLVLDPSLAVLADYGQLVPEPLLELSDGALNLHPSLLPRHRGASPIPAAILAGDRLTGVTLMRMDAGLDTGPIVAERRWALDGDETAPELEAALADEAAELLAATLEPWLRGALPPRPQPADGATLTRPLRREDGRLDPSRSADELERRVRALRPWPGTYLETDRGRLIVHAASADPAPVGAPPGTLGEQGLATAAGTLVLHEVQPAGGRVMPWSEYRRGRPASRVVPSEAAP